MRRAFLILITLFLAISRINAQTESLHNLSLELLGGSSISTISVYEEEDMNIIGFTGAFRIMWEPEKLLRIGLEGGLLHLAHSKEDEIITDFGITKRSNSLNAYPLMVNFSMKIWKMELILGLGAALVTSKINAFNEVSESSVITSSKMYGAGFSYPLTNKLRLGCEFKFYSFSTPQLTIATFQLKGKYALLQW